ncbi:uncharacterized protein LOC113324762 [Papaver somniferum]|uniref:uncharacterized protein LOC113324762 n=1 Tax=Papaver somniferum TaxID=3469 RepID=UPI000E6F8D45|nr:uncharacterized protein LOC113324762 [Papaver somniferum]
MWKVIHNTLPVKNNLHHTTNTDDICVLCNAHRAEDVNHLFFTCPFVVAIWRACLPQHLDHLQKFATLQEWIISWTIDVVINFSSESPSLHGMIATIWYIWKYRFKVHYQHEIVNPNSTLHPFFHYLANIIPISHTSHNSQSAEHNHHWTPPPPDTLKINIDASFRKPFNLAGIAMLTRNSTGSYVAGKRVLKRVNHVHQAESWALLEAMHWAEQQNWKKVVFESDCENVVLSVNEGLLPSWQSSPLLHKCVQPCNLHSNWSCVYIPRVCNKATDCLAKFVGRTSSTGEWRQVPSASLTIKIANDVPYV